MAKVTDTYHHSTNSLVVISDCTPLRSGDSSALERLEGLSADFISVAYNPGKLVRADSIATAYVVKKQLGTDVVFSLATRDMNKIALGSQLLGAQMLGLENVVVLQGDHFSEKERALVRQVNDLTSTDLIRSIHSMNNGLDYRGARLRGSTDFCIGATLDLGRDLKSEAQLAYRKSKAGAHYFITQPTYDLARREQFLDLYANVAQGPITQPVFWGVQVLDKEGIFLGAIPERILSDLAKDRPGYDIAAEALQEFLDAGIRGVYLVPPILRGGARDYQAAQKVLTRFKE